MNLHVPRCRTRALTRRFRAAGRFGVFDGHAGAVL